MSKQKVKRTGYDKVFKHKDLVSSKIENTKLKGGGLIQYRLRVSDMSKKIKDYAVKLNPNLLSVKLALMGAVREVEEMMKERKN